MAWEEGVKALTSAGVKSVTLANNHITDFGGDAVLFTEKILKSNGIEYFGSTDGKQPPYTHQVIVPNELKKQ